ncbi:MAG TPA: hypothetical protein VF761_17130 [Gemmatimonadaceae bacterium]
MDVGVTFDEEKHLYTLNGRRLLGVTKVLNLVGYYDFSNIDPIYRDRGKDAHSAVHYAMEGDLDRAHLEAAAERGAMNLIPYVDAAEKFVLENDIEIIHPEAILVAAKIGFAGKADAFGFVRKRRSLCVFDWKLGDLIDAYGIQLAAYKLAWWEMSKELVAHRYCVKLLPDGNYKVREYPMREAARDERRFLDAVGVVNTRLELGTLKPAEVWAEAA